jgi:hypothetical protein
MQQTSRAGRETMLHFMMSNGAEISLVFEENRINHTLEAHAAVLRLHSQVAAAAAAAAAACFCQAREGGCT